MIKSNQIGDLPQVLATPNVIKTLMSNPKDHSILTLAALESVMMDYPAGKVYKYSQVSHELTSMKYRTPRTPSLF